jgi:hypothetical protein
MKRHDDENIQKYVDTHQISHGQVHGFLHSRYRESKITRAELVVVVMLSRYLTRCKTEKIPVHTLHDLWQVLQEAHAWVEKETKGSVRLSLNKFSVRG